MAIAPTMTMGTIKLWKNNIEGHHAYGFAVADDPNTLPIPGADIYIGAVDLPDGLELQPGDRVAFTIRHHGAGLAG
jgi:hypothetical protein